MSRFVAAILMLGLATPAIAADIKICVVDAESAINETKDGQKAQTDLQAAYSAMEKELAKERDEIQAAVSDYEQRALILSDAAKRKEEEALAARGQEFQMRLAQADQEMQAAYMEALQGLQVKLLEVASTLGARSGCTVLLQKAAAIYTDSSVVDLTSELVKEYDAKP